MDGSVDPPAPVGFGDVTEAEGEVVDAGVVVFSEKRETHAPSVHTYSANMGTAVISGNSK